MSGSLKPGDNLAYIGRFIGDLDRRLRDLESTYSAGDELVVFSKAGAADTSMSGYHPVRSKTRLFRLTVAATTAASSDSEITLYVNGLSVATVTLPSGASYASTALTPNVLVDAGDLISTAVTTVGTDLAGVTVLADGGR